MPSSTRLEACNRTELYQLCRRAGITAHPATPRHTLISYLTGDEEPLSEDHPIDSWRHGIIGFIQEYWSMLETQLVCPAKDLRHPENPNPRPCFGCVDAQVITCVVDNAENEHLIQLHRPRRA